MTSKEALKNIGKCYITSEGKDLMFSDNYGNDYDIIEKDLDRLEELEKENEDLRIENAEAFHNLAIQDYFLGKFKVAIQQAIELLSVDGKGTKQEVKKILSEVVEND